MDTLQEELKKAIKEEWLGEIEEKLDYKRWYCGHYHTVKKIDKMQFMFEDIDVLKGK